MLIVDHDPLSRRALAEQLEADRLFAVVAEAADGPGAVRAARTFAPAIALLELDVPGGGAVEVTHALLVAAPGISVVVLALEDDEEAGLRTLRAGARGFLSKTSDLSRLSPALAGVLRGEPLISRRLARALLDRLPDVTAGPVGLRPVRSTLTGREWEVLDLLAAGVPLPHIAEELDLGLETVRRHLRHILGKLGVLTTADAVRAAERLRVPGRMRGGLVPVPSVRDQRRRAS